MRGFVLHNPPLALNDCQFTDILNGYIEHDSSQRGSKPVLSELLLHGRYQSFVVCKMGDCLLEETGNSGKKRALLAYSSGKISSTQPAVQCSFASGWVREFTHTPPRITMRAAPDACRRLFHVETRPGQ